MHKDNLSETEQTSEQESDEWRNAEQQEALLPNELHAEHSATKQAEDHIFDPTGAPQPTCKLFTLFLKLALPAIFTNIMGYATVVVNGVFAGRMNDPVNLAIVGLTSACCNVMGISLVFGLNSA